MGSEWTFSVLATVIVVIGLWTPLSSGCPAEVPYPAEAYRLNDTVSVYPLGPVCGLRPDAQVAVITPCSSCRWLVNGSQMTASYIHPYSSSIVLQPFDQNLRNTNITCICRTNTTRRYQFEIGDVCGKCLKLPGEENVCIVATIRLADVYSICVCVWGDTTVHNCVPIQLHVYLP